MICRTCANMFDDSLSSCPECGTPAVIEDGKDEADNEKKEFVLNIPEEEIEKPIVITAVSKSEGEKVASLEETEEEEFEHLAVHNEQNGGQKAPKGVKPISKQIVKKQGIKKNAVKDTVGDKSAAALIVSIMCILACMMTVLTFVSVKSDVFKGGGDVVKTVALSGLSGEETGELEQWLSTVGAVCDSEFDFSRTTVSELLSLARPYDSKGLYQSFYGSVQITANIPDPANRFKNENGDYAYYKIDEEKIDAIVELFCLNVNHTVNFDDCYYYDGYYYFGEKLDFEPMSSYIADVKNGKRIQDGSYYVECSFLQENNLSSEAKERYLIVDKITDETTSEISWKLKRISSEPVFDESGILTQSKGEVSFEMKTETFEKKASDGTVYHKYIIEYPVFSGESLGEKTANQLYSDMITALTSSDESLQSDYERFTKYGGKTQELPLITHVISRVTYNKNGYISVIEETAKYLPDTMPPENIEELIENGEYEAEEVLEDFDQADEPITFPKRTVEGYNFDLESGDFVTKDEIIGKDYQTISELLYRIYGGYGYEDITRELEKKALEAQQSANTEEQIQSSDDESEYSDYNSEDAEQEEIPEDEDELGMKIYESASVICDSGYMFCFVTDDGCAHDVIIPFEIPNLFVMEFAE